MYNDDAFATMLLTIPLSADRAEYARPLNTAEYARVLARVKSSAAGRLGALLRADISGLMMLLGVSEEEGYRLYTLLHRGVQLTYALEMCIRDRLYPEIYSCIGCNACTKACPQSLNVMQYIAYAQRGEFKKCAEESFDCVMCGICSSRCPAGISHPQVALLARRLNGQYIACLLYTSRPVRKGLHRGCHRLQAAG